MYSFALLGGPTAHASRPNSSKWRYMSQMVLAGLGRAMEEEIVGKVG